MKPNNPIPRARALAAMCVAVVCIAPTACDLDGTPDARQCVADLAWKTSHRPAAARPAPKAVSVRTPGYLHTDGARIVDHRGDPVRLRGVNWFGLETTTFALHGLHHRGLGSMLDQMVRLGFDTLRVPFSSEGIERNPPPADGAIDYGHNPELVGLRYLGLLDALVDAARVRGLRIILDRHATYAWEVGGTPGCGQVGPWYEDDFPEEMWVRHWEELAARYLGDTTVIGFDLHNEPGNEATWGGDDVATDWAAAATRAGDAVLAVNPELLVIVEGTYLHDGEPTWLGGNLLGARTDPIRLALPNQLVYSVHEYATSVADQFWFDDADFPANLEARWDHFFGFLMEDDIAPVLVGEFGTTLEDPRDQQWLTAWLAYLEEHQYSFTVWSWNPNSSDTGGVLADDWRNVREDFYAQLVPLLVD